MAQDQPVESRRCQICGEVSEGRARYCWNCGARLADAPSTSFTQTLAEVVPEASVAPPPDDERPKLDADVSDPATSIAPATATPSVAPAWTAADVWTGTQSASTTATNFPSVTAAPPKRGVGRTIWIVLGILAFIVLFCCVASIVLVAVSSRDSAFQHQVSLFAQARR